MVRERLWTGDGMGHSWGLCFWYVVSVARSSPLLSTRGPAQQPLDSLVLMAVAWVVCNKAVLVLDVITDERANLVYITN